MSTRNSWREYLFLTLGYIFTLAVIFFIINIIHFNFLHPRIVLHAIAIDCVISIVATSLLLIMIRILPLNPVYLLNACFIFILLASLYNVLGPTMCDRSLSVFLLLKLKQYDDLHKPMTKELLVKTVDQEYVRGPHMTEKRLAEHQASGAIKIDRDTVTLTPEGKMIASIFESIYRTLNIPKTF